MAGRANAKAVEQAVNGPDFEAALAIINGRVANAKEAQAKASGDASQAWASIEKLDVNRAGAQMFAKIQSLEDDDEVQDRLRTFYKLCQLEGIVLRADLLDEAKPVVPTEKTNPAPPTKAAVAKPAPEAPAGDTDLADGATGVDLGGAKPDGNSDADWEAAGAQAATAAGKAKAKLSIVTGGAGKAGTVPDAI